MKRAAPGIKILVRVQLNKVTWRFSNTYTRINVHGIKRLVLQLLMEGTWKCWNTHMRMDVLGTI